MSRPEVSRAKQVCLDCPVRRRCLEEGLEEDWGIWGGLTKPERMRAMSSLRTKESIMKAFDAGTLDDKARL